MWCTNRPSHCSHKNILRIPQRIASRTWHWDTWSIWGMLMAAEIIGRFSKYGTPECHGVIESSSSWPFENCHRASPILRHTNMGMMCRFHAWKLSTPKKQTKTYNNVQHFEPEPVPLPWPIGNPYIASQLPAIRTWPMAASQGCASGLRGVWCQLGSTRQWKADTVALGSRQWEWRCHEWVGNTTYRHMAMGQNPGTPGEHQNSC